MDKLNPSLKHNLVIGLFIGIWISAFAFFIRPFDDGSLHFRWTRISIGFGTFAILCYGLVAILQKYIYEKIAKWNIGYELIALFSFHACYIVSTYTLYKSPLYNGIYTFYEFISIIMLKVALILSPLILLARRYSIKLIPSSSEVLAIRGENKLDKLNIYKSELICISNAHNYVEIFFIQNGTLCSKLIRTSLKKMLGDLDFLIQVHRSHLINPSHFRSWKNQKTILLTQLEIPVSKNYKKNTSLL